MLPLKINYRQILSLMLIGAFCLILLGVSVSVGVLVAEDNPRFVELKSVHISYDNVEGTEMVKSGSKVTVEIVLTNFSRLIDTSGLIIESDLGVPPGIFVDGVSKEYRVPFVVDHRTVEEVRVVLVGNAPEVNMRKVDLRLLKLTQKIGLEEYLLIDIIRDVSSRVIEDALAAIHEARAVIGAAGLAIADAEAEGLNVRDAEISLELADKYLDTSQRFYNDDMPKEALDAARSAFDSAKEAKALVDAAVGARAIRDKAIIGAVIVIVAVVVVLLLLERQRRRRVY